MSAYSNHSSQPQFGMPREARELYKETFINAWGQYMAYPKQWWNHATREEYAHNAALDAVKEKYGSLLEQLLNE